MRKWKRCEKCERWERPSPVCGQTLPHGRAEQERKPGQDRHGQTQTDKDITLGGRPVRNILGAAFPPKAEM